MEEKSIHIIEQSIKLFAKKGFSSTSVQEIANECGISKGAFYLHFKSKDSLLLELFNYFYQQMQSQIDDIEAQNLDPRTEFSEQLRITFQLIADHREFIIMQIREQAIPFNENIEEFLKKMRFNSYLFYKRHLLAIYGEGIEATVWELSLLLQGIFKAFIDLIIVENIDLSFDEISGMILKRADYLVEGFRKSGDSPVINEEIMNQIIPEGFYKQQYNELIQSLIDFQKKASGDLEVTLTVLLEEMEKPDPRTAVIKGMLSNLEGEQSLKGVASQIRAYYQI